MFAHRQRDHLKIVAQPVHPDGEFIEAGADADDVLGQGADLPAVESLLLAHGLHIGTQGLQVVKNDVVGRIGHTSIISATQFNCLRAQAAQLTPSRLRASGPETGPRACEIDLCATSAG